MIFCLRRNMRNEFLNSKRSQEEQVALSYGGQGNLRRLRFHHSPGGPQSLRRHMPAGPEQTLTIPSKDQLVESAQIVWKTKDIPTPPDDLFETLERGHREGFLGFKPYYYKETTFTNAAEFLGPGGDWILSNIQNGNIDKEAAHLRGMWVLTDSTPKPKDYNGGRQMYPSDRLGAVLKELRDEGKIEVPYWHKSIPVDSRFAVSPDEIDNLVVPEVAIILGADESQITVPKKIERDVLNYLYQLDLDDGNTLEWLAERFGSEHRLMSGYVDFLHLADINYYLSNHQDNMVGFRLQIGFPTST